MTSREMIVAFTQLLESKSSYDISRIYTSDIFYYINEAIQRYVTQAFREFETNQRVSDNISTLIIKEANINTTFTAPLYTPNYLIDRIAFPSNYLYLLNVKAQVLKSNSGDFDYTVDAGARIPSVGYSDYTTKSVLTRISQHDDILKLNRDPFNKSEAEYPLATISQQGLDVYTDSTFIVNKCIIDYIRQPAEVSDLVDSDLPAFIHRELIIQAINLFLTQTDKANESP